jgi:hypothetical protein
MTATTTRKPRQTLAGPSDDELGMDQDRGRSGLLRCAVAGGRALTVVNALTVLDGMNRVPAGELAIDSQDFHR